MSTFETPTIGKRELAIDLSRLKPPLRGIADDAALGGTAGHVSIVPVDENGRVAKELLEEWAASRDQDEPHPFTQIILDAIVPENERGSP